MKRALFITILITSLFIIKNLLVSIYTLWQKQDLIVQAQKELDQEKKHNLSLKKQVADTQSPLYIEEQVRNKLFMIKPGERQIVLPQPSPTASKGNDREANSKSNWLLWKELFF